MVVLEFKLRPEFPTLHPTNFNFLEANLRALSSSSSPTRHCLRARRTKKSDSKAREKHFNQKLISLTRLSHLVNARSLTTHECLSKRTEKRCHSHECQPQKSLSRKGASERNYTLLALLKVEYLSSLRLFTCRVISLSRLPPRASTDFGAYINSALTTSTY